MTFASDGDDDDDDNDEDGVDPVMTSTIGKVWGRQGAQRNLSPC